MTQENSIGDVITFPDRTTGKCIFRLVKNGKTIGEVMYEDAVGPDGKAIFEKVVEAFDHFKKISRKAPLATRNDDLKLGHE